MADSAKTNERERIEDAISPSQNHEKEKAVTDSVKKLDDDPLEDDEDVIVRVLLTVAGMLLIAGIVVGAALWMG